MITASLLAPPLSVTPPPEDYGLLTDLYQLTRTACYVATLRAIEQIQPASVDLSSDHPALTDRTRRSVPQLPW